MIALLLVFNESSKYLKDIIKKLKKIVKEVIIVINYDIKKRENKYIQSHSDKIIYTRNIPMEDAINKGILEVSQPWILLLEANEFLDDLAIAEIKKESITSQEKIQAYAFRRKIFLKDPSGNPALFYNFPDLRIRLFMKDLKFDKEEYSIIGWKKCKALNGHIILEELHKLSHRFIKLDPNLLKKIEYW